MHKPASVQENETQKIFCELTIQIDDRILARKPNLVLVNKKQMTCCLVVLTVSINHRVKIKESEKINKYSDFAREQKQTVGHTVDGDTICSWCTWNHHKVLEKRVEELEIRRWIESIQTTALLRLDRILRRVQETWKNLQSLRLQWKTIS